MSSALRGTLARNLALTLVWLLLSACGALLLARSELAARRSDFETDARIVHRLLSQRAVQHDAILATLALLQPGARGGVDAPEQRLPSIYPQILQVYRRDAAGGWPAVNAAALDAGELASRATGRAALAAVDLAAGHYLLVAASQSASFALHIDLRALVPQAEWPIAADSPVRVQLESGGRSFVLHAGDEADSRPWRLDFRKPLAAASQPFDVVASVAVGWAALPWLAIAGWAAFTGLVIFGWQAWSAQRSGRRRAQELLRLGQVGRLNALGELAAGMAHELNQPLTAVLASTQAAERMLTDQPPDIGTAQAAMRQAAQQARRAADVVGRLRRLVERPRPGAALQPLALGATLHRVLDLLAPDCRRLELTPQIRGEVVSVQADAVALEQIVHNLLTNALQALEQVPPAQRRLEISVRREHERGVLVVRDSGPGIAADMLPRVFEPFFSTRDAGLGLGLSLSETLAAGMGGALSARQADSRGAEFRLELPLAQAPTP